MANCQKLFDEFLEKLDIVDSKTTSMRTSKDNLKDKIVSYFQKNHSEYTPEFFIQGSYKMGTSIRTKDDECDLDLGVYIKPKPDVSAATLQQWVFDAVDGTTSATPSKKNKCIRIKYSAGYHIDLPIYRKDKTGDEIPELAIKSVGFEKSDAKGIVEWFNGKKKDNSQLVHLIKYLKAWADNIRESMPPGLAWTIMTVKNQKKKDGRDDIALRDTLKEILSSLEDRFECKVPAEPFDDIFDNYSDDKKNKIKEYLQKFIDDATKAINEPNEKKASRIWQKHLGSRFPEGEDKDNETQSKLNALRDSILSKTARVGTTGAFGALTTGVAGATHTNFGD